MAGYDEHDDDNGMISVDIICKHIGQWQTIVTNMTIVGIESIFTAPLTHDWTLLTTCKQIRGNILQHIATPPCV